MNVFFNSTELRLRAFWRILIINGAILFSMVLVQLILGSGFMLFPVASAAVVMAIILILGSKIDQRSAKSYGINLNKAHIYDVLLGALFAVLVMATLFLLANSFGWIVVKESAFNRGFLTSNKLMNHFGYLLIMISVGFYEELWTRSYLLINLKEGFELPKATNLDEQESRNLVNSPISWPIIIAVILSSSVFAILHFGNPNVSTHASINIFLAGVALAIPFILTGKLGFSIGLHIGWNYAQGGIFGWAVSGTLAKGNLFAVEQLSSFNYLHGGSFGPEGGYLGTFGIVLMVLCSLWWVRQGKLSQKKT